jgi:hypothetical protein
MPTWFPHGVGPDERDIKRGKSRPFQGSAHGFRPARRVELVNGRYHYADTGEPLPGEESGTADPGEMRAPHLFVPRSRSPSSDLLSFKQFGT